MQNRFLQSPLILNTGRYFRYGATKHTYSRGLQSEAYSHNKQMNPSSTLNSRSVLFFGFPIALTFSLGVWQVKRLERKKQLIKERELSLHATPIDASQLLAGDSNTDFRRVSISGRFHHNLEMLVGPRSAPKGLPTPVLQWGGSSGLQVITPFELDDGNVILVNRGWIPQRLNERRKRKNPAVNPHPFLLNMDDMETQSYDDDDTTQQRTEIKSFTAVVRRRDERNRFTPENAPERNEWFYIDPQQMLEQCKGVEGTKHPVVVELLEPLSSTGWPHPRGFEEFMQFRTPPSTHVTYATTWFSLSAMLALLTRHRFRTRVRRTS